MDRKSDMRAITVAGPGHYSLPLYSLPDYSEFAEYGDFTASWIPSKLSDKPFKWTFECTGKVTENARYEISFIQVAGRDGLRIRNLKIWKRDELMAELPLDAVLHTDDGALVCPFEMKFFEAGTPFVVEVELCGDGGTDSSGYVFVRKVS
ncbi:hypothetical protein EVA_09309 [gut metagenome]|uniref:Uncharacterized protein n=1 Tax=gut metagenome TaxID=749906 RepID=J9G6W2_9ZZZZ